MTNQEKIKRRLLGILNHDGIDAKSRMNHLMQRCGISRYLAKRALNGYLPKSAYTAMDMANALNVSVAWLLDGRLETMHPRTFRIHWHALNYPKQDIDNMSRMMVRLSAGQQKARNIADLIIEGKLTFPGAARLM